MGPAASGPDLARTQSTTAQNDFHTAHNALMSLGEFDLTLNTGYFSFLCLLLHVVASQSPPNKVLRRALPIKPVLKETVSSCKWGSLENMNLFTIAAMYVFFHLY